VGAITGKPTITAELRERARIARSDWKGVEGECKEALSRLAKALDQGDLRLTQSGRRMAEAALRPVAHQVAFTDKIITDLRAVQDAADDGSAELKEAGRLIAELAPVSSAAAKLFQAAKKLIAAADEKAAELARSDDEKDRKWAKGDAYIRQQCAERRPAVKEMAALYAQAQKAVEARDAAALAAAQKRAPSIGKFKLTLAQLRDTVKRVVEGVDADHVAPELRKQIAADTQAWADLLRGAEADELQIGMDRDMIAALRIEPRDVRKAAKLLGIEGSDTSRLAKALEGEAAAVLKGLESLRKQLGLDTPAKDMFATLRKAALV
jgi:hypothetical protein